MKSIGYAVVSSLCALVVGILLIIYPGDAAVYLVITLGVLFLLPGLLGIVSFIRALSQKEKESSPNVMAIIVSLGSLFFGLWLIITPQFFIGILMYVLGGLLVLCGLNQLIGFVSARSLGHVPAYVYVIPVLVLIAGIVILANPFQAAEMPFIVLGVSFVVYALTDLFRALRYKAIEKETVTDVKVIEEIKEEETPSAEEQ